MSGFGPRTAATYGGATPTNYVAGVGRGAMGFTTRSDIGPARPAPAAVSVVHPGGLGPTADAQFGVAPAGYVAGRGRGMGELARSQSEGPSKPLDGDGDRGDYSESNYDEFSGYGGEKLFNAASTPYDKEDAEADSVYDKVDNLMDSRRKRSREQQLLLDQKRKTNERPRISDQFADLKRELSTVSASEWDSIPEVGDHSLKLKQSRKKENFTPVPDSVIESNYSRNISMNQSVDPLGGGTSTVSGLAEARGKNLSSRLDSMSDDVTGQTVVDPKGYLTSLSSIKINTTAEVGDIKKAALLLKSVTTTNPKHGPGWIAAARVQEFAGKMNLARKVILEGCEICFESEDVWIEAARLHNYDLAAKILANAVHALPTSVRIWLAAADLENNNLQRKKAVLRRSLEFVPGSEKLWKAAIELENVNDARIMLARAVECVPHSVEMWLALAKLETHENARKVLNQAREAIPTERLTWITAAKLEEAHNNGHLVSRIIEKMIASLNQYNVVIDREAWIKEAEDCEHSSAPLTCHAIIKNTIFLGLDEEDWRRTWMDDAEACLAHDPVSKETARAIYNYALDKFPSKKTLWQCAAMLEKDHGTPASLDAKLREGVKHCPHGEVLWLMAAKEKWLANNIPEARAILLEAFQVNPKSEQIWLAAIKLEWESNELIRARLLLSKAREHAPTDRIYLKSALLEYEVGDYTQTIALLTEGIQKFATFTKFYLMLAQVYDLLAGKESDMGKKNKLLVEARQMYQNGIKVSPASVPLWKGLIRLEEKVKGVIKARPTGELARMKLPANDAIWLECIQLERRNKNDKLADNMMAKALQECPSSDILLSEELLTCVKTSQKSKCVEALKKCNNNAIVFTTIARLLERSNKIMKARKYFTRAININNKYGDAYIYYYIFEYLQLYKKRLILEGLYGNNSNGNSSTNGSAAQGKDAISNAVYEVSQVVQDMGAIDDELDEDEDISAAGTATLSEHSDSATLSTADAAAGASAAVSAAQEEQKNTAILANIVAQCVAAVPNSGELWCTLSKSDVALRRAETSVKLKAMVEHVLGFKLYSSSSGSSSNGAEVAAAPVPMSE